MKILRRLVLVLAAAVTMSVAAKTVCFDIDPIIGDATEVLRKAVNKAKELEREDTALIRLSAGAVYNLSRDAATTALYHVSNTTSVQENPSPIKHIGILLKDMSNVVIDGRGATLLTHGEMTPWVVDRCSNVTIKNLIVDAADPSVPEMTVSDVDSLSFTAKVHSRSKYELRDGKLYWQGEGWEFTDGIAQIYDPATATTRRCGSPVVDATNVEETAPGVLKFSFKRKPQALKGQTYQMRHSLRTEVAGLISESERVTLSDLHLRFMGNFGIVAQTSEDIYYHNLECAPDPGSGRTCAGFADFLQVSGCKGMVEIKDCCFNGSQDDPINVHGTHLKVTEWGDGSYLNVRYMHPQTFGFQSFFEGDTIEVVNPNTLLPVATAKVMAANMVDDYNIELQLDRRLPADVMAVANAVVENISYTPQVRITGCHFKATPTRGILITTRRPVLIANNVFYRTPMASILVADDARSWYESGPVKDLTICDNLFIDCALPVIQIVPEISEYAGDVHSNIKITGNKFEFEHQPEGDIYMIKAASNVEISTPTF
ncbi:MAG: alpha-1,3-galactosidase [Muribaculaceae bacterium]|nr:alpha-1,3-galactosidase [Muribaculaceae bacterium]